MMRLALAVLLLFPAGQQTVLTRDGKRHVGDVTITARSVTVRTASGVLEVPAAKVACVYADPRDAVARADALYAHAKSEFEAARPMPDRDPERNARLQGALESLALARDIYEGLSRYHSGDDWDSLSRQMAAVMQFMRLCRDQMGSSIAGGGPAAIPELLPLASGEYDFRPPADRGLAVQRGGDLGAGQGSLVRALDSKDPKARADAIRKLASPPAPHALGAMLSMLEREDHPEVLKALADVLQPFDLSERLAGMAWIRSVVAPEKRIFLTSLLKRAGGKGSCELLVAWLVECPPTDDRVRATICSAFRRMRDLATRELKDALGKAKDRKVQTELLKQIGMMADKRGAPVLLQAVTTFPSHAICGLEDIGRPAMPQILEMARANDPVRRYGLWLAQRLSGDNSLDSSPLVDRWYAQNRKSINEDEAAFWEQQERDDFPVDPRRFGRYDRSVREIVR